MYIPKPGLGNAANYISSGIPRIINNITVPASGSGAYTEELQQVPRKITIKNTLSSDSASVPILVGFFENCFDANEILELDNQQTLTGLYRPKNIYLMSSDGASEASASILLESTGINFPTSDFQWFQSESANTRGVANASSYQVSGIPQVFGKRLIEETVGYDFHHISRDVTIYNNIAITEDSAPIRVGFNSASLDEDDGNWFVLENGESYTGEWKLNSIWLKPHTATAASASIVVGLTGIKADLDFNNYSGSTVVASRKASTLPRFTNYDALYSYIESQGSSYLRAVPLYSIGSDGDDTNIIGHWGYQSGSSGYAISPMGLVNLAKVSDGGFGVVSSVDDGTTITLTSGHTLPISFKARVCDISAGVELYDNISASVSGDTLTLPDTTDIAAGDLIYALNRSEFTIGNSARNLELEVDAKCYFDNGLYFEGSSKLDIIQRPVTQITANWSGSTTSYEEKQYVAIGMYTDSDYFYVFGSGYESERLRSFIWRKFSGGDNPLFGDYIGDINGNRRQTIVIMGASTNGYFSRSGWSNVEGVKVMGGVSTVAAELPYLKNYNWKLYLVSKATNGETICGKLFNVSCDGNLETISTSNI